MYLIAAFGFLLCLASTVMVINPEFWSQLMVKFSQKTFFHPAEIVSRIFFGLGFIYYSDRTLYPELLDILGYLLIIVAVGLLLTPPSKHKHFAVWSTQKAKKYFRLAGVFSFLFGLFIMYAALSTK